MSCKFPYPILITIIGLFPEYVQQTAADPDQSRYICTGQGLTTIAKFWARSVKWGKNWGARKCSRHRGFLSAIQDHFSATSQRPIFTRFGHDVNHGRNANIGNKFRKVFIPGSFAPETPNLEGVKQAPHLEQATG